MTKKFKPKGIMKTSDNTKESLHLIKVNGTLYVSCSKCKKAEDTFNDGEILMISDGFINVKDDLPSVNEFNESEYVLCATSKFGNYNKYGIKYEILYLYNNEWLNNNTEKFEDNPDYFIVTHWMKIPKELK